MGFGLSTTVAISSCGQTWSVSPIPSDVPLKIYLRTFTGYPVTIA